MKWIDFPHESIAVEGLPWFDECTPSLRRLPERMRSRVREPVWSLAGHLSGGRLRFRTDATSLGLRLTYPESASLSNMSLIGQMGIDVYLDGMYARSFAPTGVTGPQAGDYEEVLLDEMDAGWREVCLYLPNYAPVEIRAVGLSDGAQTADTDPYAVDRPVAFYGSSITQGGCAGRPGMSYQAILSRLLDIDVVNLGFSGNGLGEPELAAAMAEIDSACYVLDFAQNLPDAEALEKAYSPFMKIVRERRPETPMVCITPIFASSELWSEKARDRLSAMRQVIRNAVSERIAGGDTALRLIEGYSLLGLDVPDGHAPHIAELLRPDAMG